jgi:hypothetical protein
LLKNCETLDGKKIVSPFLTRLKKEGKRIPKSAKQAPIEEKRVQSKKKESDRRIVERSVEREEECPAYGGQTPVCHRPTGASERPLAASRSFRRQRRRRQPIAFSGAVVVGSLLLLLLLGKSRSF